MPKKMSKGLLLLLSLFLVVSFACADVDMGKGYKAPDITPIRVMEDDKEVVITLADAFKYHGSPCPGVCMAFRSVTHVTELLWGDAIPRRDDIVMFCRGPMYGVLDLFTLVRYGDLKAKAKEKTDAVTSATPGPPIPEGMTAGRDKFWFTIIRKSTGDAVDIKIDVKQIPQDFFILRKKIKSKKASDVDEKRLNAYKVDMVKKIPIMPLGELFGKPVQYKIIMWGI